MTDQKLHIAITVAPLIPVPPKQYGGIERIVYMLVQGLIEHGHEVALFAHRDSQVPCVLKSYRRQSQSIQDTARNTMLIFTTVMREQYDIIHSFGRIAYIMPLLPLRIPKLVSYQLPITPRSVKLGDRFSGGALHYVGCSEQLIKPYKDRDNWHVIHNAAPLHTYDCQEQVEKDAPLVFLGRLEETKGAHLAIEVALRTGRELVIAGNVVPQHQLYFDERIRPQIDKKQIHYVGSVNDEQKNRLLGQASAFLMPILWEEPFGIVMAEALACGTPVIGLNRGSVAEVVQNGINGFVCESVEEMAFAVTQIPKIDRRTCRRIMEDKFSDRVMVDAYEKLYRKISQSKS